MHNRKGRRARGQALHARPRRADFLVPRHIRIQRMLKLARAPEGEHGVRGFLGGRTLRAFNLRVGIAFGCDQRRRAGRMRCREQRGCRERAIDREEDRFAATEIVEHRGDAVGPLLQGRQRTRRHGVRRASSRLIEEDQSTEGPHRVHPTLYGREFGDNFAVCEPVGHEDDVTCPFTRSAIGDAQVPIQRIARLREHHISVSPGERRYRAKLGSVVEIAASTCS